VTGGGEPAPSDEACFDLSTSYPRDPGHGVTLAGRLIGWSASGVGYLRDRDQIDSVGLETITGEALIARCDIGFSIGPALTVAIVDASDVEIVTFRDFVRALIARLSPVQRGRIAFRYGTQPETRAAGMIIGMLGGLLPRRDLLLRYRYGTVS
jgi:hypothetical protein